MELQDTNTYVNTYFRINSGYVWGKGHTEEQSQAYYEEVTKILSAVGFEIIPGDRYGSCPVAVKGNEILYLHPMEASGYVLQQSIPAIEEALSNATGFSLRGVDTYDEVFFYTLDEFKAALEGQRKIIEEKILDKYRTKRKNLCIIGDYPATETKSGLKYFKGYFDKQRLKEIEWAFAYDVFESLIAKGLIVKYENLKRGTGYRTVTEKELKAASKSA